MPEFHISPEIKAILPHCRLGILKANIRVENSSAALLNEIELQIWKLQKNLTIEEVSGIPLIEQTKNAYRTLGKDPSRYRPSAEALTRRILLGKELYQVNNIVDLLNLISIRSGYSIGGYDADFIEGDVELSIGKENEPYDAIGRGILNIFRLPVLRDKLGAFGSPTSDSKRTMVRNATKHFIMVFFDLISDDRIINVYNQSEEYLLKFGSAEKIHFKPIDT